MIGNRERPSRPGIAPGGKTTITFILCLGCALLLAALLRVPAMRGTVDVTPVSATQGDLPLPEVPSSDPAVSGPGTQVSDSAPEETGVPVPAQTEEPETPLTEAGQTGPSVQPGEPQTVSPAEDETLSVSLRRGTDTANAVGSTVVIKPGRSYPGTLSSASDYIDYEFDLTRRGVLCYGIGAETDDRGDWKVSLYQRYYVNGNGGETALRLLNVLNANKDDGDRLAPNIGLTSGRYVLRVESGAQFVSGAVYRLQVQFAPGTEYEMEYNDSKTRYNEIYTGVPVKGSASYFDSGRDTDWYLLRLYTDTAVNLLFTHGVTDRTTVAFKVCLFDEDGHELYGGSAVLNNPLLESGRIGLPAGNYYISVQGRVYNESDYTLTVQRGTAASETEPNDTFAAATPITQAQPLRGALSARSGSADRDYYVFTLDAPGYVNVFLQDEETNVSDADYVRRLVLMDADGHTLFSEMQSDGGAEIRSPGVGLAAGTYYLCVNNDNLYLNSKTYVVGYTFTQSAGWEHEYNGTPESADALTDGVSVSGTLSDVESDFDTDWFTFTVAKEGGVLLQLRHEKLGGNNDIFNLTLYNAELQPAGETLVSYESSETVSGRYTLAPGTYYVKVTAGKYSRDVRYYLTFSIEK